MNKFIETIELRRDPGHRRCHRHKSTNFGLAGGMHTEDWVFDHPEKILDLEKAFVTAGSDIILTCTFGGTGCG